MGVFLPSDKGSFALYLFLANPRYFDVTPTQYFLAVLVAGSSGSFAVTSMLTKTVKQPIVVFPRLVTDYKYFHALKVGSDSF